MLSLSHHLARTGAAAAARCDTRPGRRLTPTRVAAAVAAAAALLAAACSAEEPPAPPAVEETTTTTEAAPAEAAAADVTAAPAVASPCIDPDAEDLGDGLVELDGIVYEVSADACVPRSEAGQTIAEPEPEPEPEPAPSELLAEGQIPAGEHFSEPQSEPEPEPSTTTTQAPEPEPEPSTTTTQAPEPEPEPEPPTTTTQPPEPEPEPPTTTTQPPEPEPEPPTTTTQPPEPEPEPEPEPVGSPITRESICDLVEGTWDTSVSPPQCVNPSRVFAPLPEPVGEPVTLVADEEDSFVSGSGRRIVRSEPTVLRVGSIIPGDRDAYSIVTEIEDIGSGWWQVVVCTIHEFFVLADVGNVGWQGVAYAWLEDDGRFRVEQDNWGPGNDGAC